MNEIISLILSGMSALQLLLFWSLVVVAAHKHTSNSVVQVSVDFGAARSLKETYAFTPDEDF